MAIDTRNERSSAIVVDKPYVVMLPNPDGVVDVPDRQQLAFSYTGISTALKRIVTVVLRMYRERWS